MKSKFWQGLYILIFFIIFVVQQPFALPDIFNEMHYGIIHLNSLFFIISSAIILWSSIDKDIKDANKLHKGKEVSTKEAKLIFEKYFEDKMTIDTLVAESNKNETVLKVLNIIKYGGAEEDLVLGIQGTYNNISSKYIKLKNDYEYLATIMPIIGMIGTIAGLLIMFAVPEGIEDFADKFAGLSIALATTLYSSLITVLVFKPQARSIEEWLVSLENDYDQCEISLKQFFHKIDILELVDQMNQNTSDNVVENEKIQN